MALTIEKHIGETLYRQFFHSCKTLRLYAKNGKARTFVEYTAATDYGDRNNPNNKNTGLKIAVGNAVLRLIAERNEDFFYDKCEKGVKLVRVNKKVYWIKYEDITEQWTNHYWTRLKTPLIGFKAVSKNGQSLFVSKQDEPSQYSIGETHFVDEKKMLAGEKSGFFFSSEINKALSYVKKDEKVFLVVATGLVFIKNNWNDLCSSKLTIARELSREDIELLTPSIHKPAALWNGFTWELQTEIEQSE